MILVLNGADFSENNLGQVEVTTILDPFTEAAITASGNASMTGVQKATLNSFFKKLGAFGSESNIWSKMQYVFLPMLASDLAHSMINYVGNSNSIIPDATKFKMRSHGITGYDDTARRIDVTAGTALDLQDMSVLFMDTENLVVTKKVYIGSSSSARGTWGFAKSSQNEILISALYNSGAPSIAKTFYSATLVATDYNKLGGISVNGTSYSIMNSRGTVSSYTESGIPSGTSTTVRLFSDLTTGITQAASATGLLMIGSHLSDAELLVVKTAAEKLRDAFVIA